MRKFAGATLLEFVPGSFGDVAGADLVKELHKALVFLPENCLELHTLADDFVPRDGLKAVLFLTLAKDRRELEEVTTQNNLNATKGRMVLAYDAGHLFQFVEQLSAKTCEDELCITAC